MTKLICTISILLLGLVAVARGQQTSSGELSNVDKTAIIDVVLKLELQNQTSIPFYGTIRAVSSENIEFIEPWRLSNDGFRYFPAIDIMVLKRDNVLDYLRFNQILLRDGVAVVTLSRVTEGRPCFAAPFSSEKGYTYKVRQTVVGWIAELTQTPASPLSFSRPSFSRKGFARR
jgi:hypothetical protein